MEERKQQIERERRRDNIEGQKVEEGFIKDDIYTERGLLFWGGVTDRRLLLQ